MLASEKRKQERDEQKSARIQHILDCTYKLFSTGIESVSMNEIADNAEIGVASLYRYFSTKDILAIECASYAWEIQNTKLLDYVQNDNFNKLNGYEQIDFLLSLFPKYFHENKQFFRFIYLFDAFIKRENVTPDRLQTYEGKIVKTEQIVLEAIKKGRADNSINAHDSTDEELYFTITHSLFSLAQKLSLTDEMLFMDKSIPAIKRMELLSKLLLSSIRN